MKTIHIELGSSRSIQSAIDEIESYKQELQQKIETLVNNLVAEGVKVAAIRVASTQGDSKLPDVDYEIDPQGEIVKAKIKLLGSDALFVEFGAGIAYNTGKQHPLAGELGYGPGTYPSEHPPNKAINPGFWYYNTSDSAGTEYGKRSIGTEATMPLYGALESVRNNAIVKAIEIFRS